MDQDHDADCQQAEPDNDTQTYPQQSLFEAKALRRPSFGGIFLRR